MCPKYYQNITWFDKVIAKIKWCSLFDSHGSTVYHRVGQTFQSEDHTVFLNVL